MKLYTYFIAVEIAYNRVTNNLDFPIETPKVKKEWKQYIALRDGLINRFERIEYKNTLLQIELNSYKESNINRIKIEETIWYWKCERCGWTGKDADENIMIYAWESDTDWGNDEACKRCFENDGDVSFLDVRTTPWEDKI